MTPLSSSGHTPFLVYCASSSLSSIIVSLFYFQLFILAGAARKKMAEIQPRLQVVLFLIYCPGSRDHCSAETVLFFASLDFFFASKSKSWSRWILLLPGELSLLLFIMIINQLLLLSPFSWPLRAQLSVYAHTHFQVGSPSTYWFIRKDGTSQIHHNWLICSIR